jgi:hypothetical protein
MNISEETFTHWAQAPGATEAEKSEHAEKAVRKAIAEDEDLAALDTSVFVQGSYRALTNVRQESDVDICVRYNAAFFADYPEGKSRVDFGHIPSDLKYADFKDMVEVALRKYFRNDGVTRGDKAFDVRANTYRIDADVIPTFERRLYTGRVNSDGTHHFLKGVAFKPDKGPQINNWPDQNYDMGGEKNSACEQNYKRTVRIVKRLYYKMKEENTDTANNIGSFLIESLLYNVPNEGFLHDTFTADVRFVLAHAFNKTLTDKDCADWREVNNLKFLFQPGQSWTRPNVHDFLSAAWDYVGFE